MNSPDISRQLMFNILYSYTTKSVFGVLLVTVPVFSLCARTPQGLSMRCAAMRNAYCHNGSNDILPYSAATGEPRNGTGYQHGYQRGYQQFFRFGGNYVRMMARAYCRNGFHDIPIRLAMTLVSSSNRTGNRCSALLPSMVFWGWL